MSRKTHISIPVPVRPRGQHNVLGLKAGPMESVRIGIVGLGIRGQQALQRLSRVPGASVDLLCDTDPSRLPDGVPSVTDWHAACRAPLDLIYICTDWSHHVPVALEAMDCGKHVAIEVPAAQELEQIWALVNKAEQTRLHCMMLENAVYDDFENTTRAMAEAGVFGELVHAEGAYLHRIDFAKEQWRIAYNRTQRGDIYPTHGFGPVCRALGIHRQDRLATLVSMDTAPFTGASLDSPFANGDQTCTLLKTTGGRTVLLEHNIMTPRPYSRMYQLVGSRGYAAKYPVPQICLLENGQEHLYQGEELEALMAPYRPAWLPPELEAVARESDKHGGMDYIMDYRLVQALRSGAPLDMDVYDLAEWCAVAPLSRISLEAGSQPVEFPDFTRP